MCILLCRPTKSPGLYVQMVGRGLRPHPDKENVLILDLSSNCMYHGDPNNPRVKIGKDPAGIDIAPMKVCPNCDLVVPISTKECPECSHIFFEEAEDDDEAKKCRKWPGTKHQPRWWRISKKFAPRILSAKPGTECSRCRCIVSRKTPSSLFG